MYEIPKMMRAAVINDYGSNDEVHLADVPIPLCGDDDVLVKVEAASVNPLDTRIRDGKLKLPLPYKLPLILGNDFSGIVVAVGSSVNQFNVGDAVYGRSDTMRIGAFAEYTVIKSTNLALRPANLTITEAASLPLVALTAWQVLVEKSNISKGSKVLIHGGAGGVGSISIQLAKHLGAYVATTASSYDFDRLKSYGADELIDYRTEDFSTTIHNYDLVLDTRGGETLKKSLGVLKKGGKVISINGTPDANMANELHLGLPLKLIFAALSLRTNMLAKKLGVTYSFLFMKPSGSQLEELTDLLDKNVLKPVVDKVYSFEQVKEALAYSESGKAKGKIVIKF